MSHEMRIQEMQEFALGMPRVRQSKFTENEKRDNSHTLTRAGTRISFGINHLWSVHKP